MAEDDEVRELAERLTEPNPPPVPTDPEPNPAGGFLSLLLFPLFHRKRRDRPRDPG